MSSGSDIIQKNVNIIPQIFYDIIARIVPGIILIGFAVVIYIGPNKAIELIKEMAGTKDTIKTVSFSFHIMLIISAYLLSLIIIGFRHFFVRAYRLIRKPLVTFLKRFKLLRKSFKMFPLFFRTLETKWNHYYKKAFNTKNQLFNESDTIKDIPSMHFLYDYIRIHAPDIGSRLVKVHAECHMCAVLFIGFALLSFWNGSIFFINSVASYKPTLSNTIIEVFFIVASVSLLLLKKELEGRYARGVSGNWFILKNMASLED